MRALQTFPYIQDIVSALASWGRFWALSAADYFHLVFAITLWSCRKALEHASEAAVRPKINHLEYWLIYGIVFQAGLYTESGCDAHTYLGARGMHPSFVIFQKLYWCNLKFEHIPSTQQQCKALCPQNLSSADRMFDSQMTKVFVKLSLHIHKGA